MVACSIDLITERFCTYVVCANRDKVDFQRHLSVVIRNSESNRTFFY